MEPAGVAKDPFHDALVDPDREEEKAGGEHEDRTSAPEDSGQQREQEEHKEQMVVVAVVEKSRGQDGADRGCLLDTQPLTDERQKHGKSKETGQGKTRNHGEPGFHAEGADPQARSVTFLLDELQFLRRHALHP
jgi:hypothetical protein